MALRMTVAMCMLLASSLVAAEEAPLYRVDMELWLDGEKRGAPTMIIKGGTAGSIEVGGEDAGWRIELEIEQPGPGEGAPGGAVWLHVGVHRREDGQWDHLVDSILGVPEGEPATLSMVEDSEAEPVPENSLVYLIARISRQDSNELD